jgi:Outer membrane protein beta-barrel domain
MRMPVALGGLLLLSVSSMLAQNANVGTDSANTDSTAASSTTSDAATTRSTTTRPPSSQPGFPTIETAPGFLFIRTSLNLTNDFTVHNPNNGNSVTATGANQFNCAGAGTTLAYNLSSLIGVAADLGGCKIFGNTIGLGNKISGSQFNYLFGPRLTFRGSSPFVPFFDLGFGGNRISVSCQNSATACVNATGGNSYSKNAFAMSVGGGFDIRMTRKISLRPIQAEYLYTRFGNQCALAVCSNNNNQNSFRLKSGIVVAWGGSASGSK